MKLTCQCGAPISRKATTGRCRRCYNRDRMRAAYAANPGKHALDKPVPCARCGIKTRRTEGICRDCRDVLAVEEIGRWAS